MWKPTTDEPRRPAAPSTPAAQAPVTAQPIRPATLEAPARSESPRSGAAHIGKSVVIRGALSGSEDLYFDGEIEGSVELKSNVLTVGPNARIQADIEAKELVVLGNVNGNVVASKVELRNSASLVGNIVTARIHIDDGAFFKGGIDIQRGSKSE